MKEKVEAALAKVRPMLAADGGGVELVSVDEKSGGSQNSPHRRLWVLCNVSDDP